MLSQIGIQMVSIIDNIMVGKLGKIELSGVAFGGSVYFFFFLFLLGIAIALTAIVGSYFSQKQIEKIAEYFQNSFLLFNILGIGFFLILYLTRNKLLNAFNQPIEVVEKAIPYYTFMISSIIPYMLYASFKQLLDGMGKTKINMVVILTANVINIVLNYVFIYGNFGFPQMGGAGAGLASLISTCFLPILLFLYTIVNKEFKEIYHYFSIKKFSFKINKELFRLGLPIGLQIFIENLTFVATTIMVGWISTAEIAANQIAIKMASLAFMISIGINTAVTICVSQSYGIKNIPQIKKYSICSAHLSLCFSFIIATIFILFRVYIANIFIDDIDVILIASNLIICVALFQFSDGLQSTFIGILRGLQDVKMLIPISFLAYILIDFPLAYFLTFSLGLNSLGLWISFILGLSVAGILYFFRIKKTMKTL